MHILYLFDSFLPLVCFKQLLDIVLAIIFTAIFCTFLFKLCMMTFLSGLFDRFIITVPDVIYYDLKSSTENEKIKPIFKQCFY